MPLKTLFLNPPSFENFDGGASSRWPATREIESYWYPVWLAYPAGMLEGSRLLDANPHHITWPQVVEILKDYEFLVLFTSTIAWNGDQQWAQKVKETYPNIKICFRRPARHHRPRPGPQRVPRHRLRLPPRVRLLRRRVRQRQAAQRNPRHQLSEERPGRRTIPTARRSRTSTRCPGSPKSTSATST